MNPSGRGGRCVHEIGRRRPHMGPASGPGAAFQGPARALSGAPAGAGHGASRAPPEVWTCISRPPSGRRSPRPFRHVCQHLDSNFAKSRMRGSCRGKLSKFSSRVLTRLSRATNLAWAQSMARYSGALLPTDSGPRRAVAQATRPAIAGRLPSRRGRRPQEPAVSTAARPRGGVRVRRTPESRCSVRPAGGPPAPREIHNLTGPRGTHRMSHEERRMRRCWSLIQWA